jgi:shikimate kinase / 3-dehydroquinate synthase
MGDNIGELSFGGERMKTVEVALGARSYPIIIGTGTLLELTAALQRVQRSGAVGIVTDTHVAPLYLDRVSGLVRAAGLEPVPAVMSAGEEYKRLARIEELTGLFLKGGLDRSSCVVALGGGVVGDIAGFAAATFMRGIPFIQVPTTIVAQVDSSVGGKTGVNHPFGKNIIGAFHQPTTVIIDTELLRSLPDRELRAGLAEVIKHGIIADAELFVYMERHVDAVLAKELSILEHPIERSCEIKGAIVAADEREQGLRAILNYGHTFGHAIEAVTEYVRYLHGEAIALGMMAAAVLSRDLGHVDQHFVDRQRACLAAYGLPVRWPEIPVDDTLEAMKHDKKVRSGVMKFIVAECMGRAGQRNDISVDQARRAIESLRE